ncbi:hypothetical protein KL86SPO_50397 [uncultured Sporomusa sp.]|uniref:Uncharacterized protein n=1 Tax=uncultured Sporomusa sp. TaxID=307249 RepID=A0A212LYN9_9FIRM|nr:hypothetical protein KL86SPO_50397 [uncultured Sporomusa sp.]
MPMRLYPGLYFLPASARDRRYAIFEQHRSKLNRLHNLWIKPKVIEIGACADGLYLICYMLEQVVH